MRVFDFQIKSSHKNLHNFHRKICGYRQINRHRYKQKFRYRYIQIYKRYIPTYRKKLVPSGAQLPYLLQICLLLILRHMYSQITATSTCINKLHIKVETFFSRHSITCISYVEFTSQNAVSRQITVSNHSKLICKPSLIDIINVYIVNRKTCLKQLMQAV